MAYADEPLADEELLKKYEAEKEENKRLAQEVQVRLAEVSLESGHRRYTAVCLSESCLSPLATLPRFFTQTLVKDKSDRHLH